MPKIPVVSLGRTGLSVSKLGFGTFDFGVSSLQVSPEKGGRILAESFRMGINLWDTSEDYGSHPHVASALTRVPRKEVVVCTKTNAKTPEEARISLKNALRELGTGYVDVFLLHYVQSEWIEDSHEVLKELSRVKKAGAIRAIGLSTHSVRVVEAASRWKELDVIMTICCRVDQATINRFHEYIPLEDGSMEDMLQAVESAHNRGKGTMAIKVLGSSTPPLVKNYQLVIKSIAKLGFVDTMVLGMRSLDEVKKNVKVVLSK